jgi:SAM-dependent methyltransferase
MSEPPYNAAFFGQHLARSLTSAQMVLRIFFQYHKPESIVDVGCGLGTWLKAAKELGVDDVLGIDGDYVDRKTLLIPEAGFHPADLRQRIVLDRRFDLAISVEVAEHLPYHRSETFVQDLTALSDVVLFSAALPYQGGTEHVNEQWLEFWAILFRRHGYVPVDLLRRQFWSERAVEFWYSQNLVIFCTADAAKMFPDEFLASGRPLSYPHPLTFLVNVARYRPLSASAVDLECEDYLSVLHTYQEGDSTLPLMRTVDATNEAGSPLFPKARTLIVDAGAGMAARDVEVRRLAGELDAARSEAVSLTGLVAARDAEISRLAEQVAASASDKERLAGELDSRCRDVEKLSFRNLRQEQEIERLSNDLSGRNLSVRQLASQLSGRESEIDRLKDELRTREQAFSHLSLALGAQVCEMRQRSEEMAGQAASLKEATALAATMERELTALKNSLTWRMTKPVRRCVGWLSGSWSHRRKVV